MIDLAGKLTAASLLVAWFLDGIPKICTKLVSVSLFGVGLLVGVTCLELGNSI